MSGTFGCSHCLQQTQYLGWVNCQLKKKPGRGPLNDLILGMHDGRAFVDLIDVVAGERISEIFDSPALSVKDKLSNISRVLEYMKKKHIRMHETLAEDIVSGDLKSIMRLILALAAYFKPSAVKHSSHMTSSTSSSQHDSREETVIGYVQSAVVTLADARRDAALTVIHKPSKPPHPDHTEVNARLAKNSERHSMSNTTTSGSLQKSTSQDFTRVSDAESRYRQLAEQHVRLSREHTKMKEVMRTQGELYEEALAEVNALWRALLSLQQLLSSESNKQTVCHMEEDLSPVVQLGSPPQSQSSQERDTQVTGAGDLLRLQNSSETDLCIQLKHELDLARNDVKSSSYQCQLLKDKNSDLERKLLQQSQPSTDLNNTSEKDDLQMARESIRMLRRHYYTSSDDEAQREAIDRLEDSFQSFVNSLSFRDLKENIHCRLSNSCRRQSSVSDGKRSNMQGLPTQNTDFRRTSSIGRDSSGTKVVSYEMQRGNEATPIIACVNKR